MARARWVRRCSPPTASLHPAGVLRALVDFTEPLGASIFPSPRWGRSAHFFHDLQEQGAAVLWAPRPQVTSPGLLVTDWPVLAPGAVACLDGAPDLGCGPPVHPDPASPSERLLRARPEPLLLPTYVGGTHT